MGTYPDDEFCKHKKDLGTCDACDADWEWNYKMYMEDQEQEDKDVKEDYPYYPTSNGKHHVDEEENKGDEKKC